MKLHAQPIVESGTETAFQPEHDSAAVWRLLDTSEPERWDAAIADCGRFDTYHLAGYHRASEHIEQGAHGLLFHYRDGGCSAAIPLMIRSLPDSLGAAFATLSDAVSAYGYPGPICSATSEADAPAGFADGFCKAFLQALQERGVISFFLRHNPLIDTAWLTEELGGQTVLGSTVALDLSKSLEEQRLEARKRIRNHYRKALEKGVSVVEDREFRDLDSFVRLYSQTMKTLEAKDFYFFDTAYYRDLKECLGDRVSLFHTRYEGRIIGSMIVFLTNGIIQYHLAGWDRDFLKLSPLRILYDHFRYWGKEHGFRWAHLGGGVGAQSDSVMEFKRDFSKTEFPYSVSRIVIDTEAYAGACRAAGHAVSEGEATEGFFPLYRQNG